ncbi:RagB/SusD family nutrient uptake outer membrane protein [Bacteroides salyersiae]|nr:RagB/SusD family nutrient uptake outer membrane protein [Bacteroides salyersiae]
MYLSLIIHSVLNQDNLDLPRDTYEKCVEFIENDCKTAAGLLPLKYADADNGRASKGAAPALRSRTLLYAARQLHNPTNDIAKWEKAAKAAKDVIDLKLYTLYPDYVNMFFQPVCSEIIMNRPRIKMNFEQGTYQRKHFLDTFYCHSRIQWLGRRMGYSESGGYV